MARVSDETTPHRPTARRTELGSSRTWVDSDDGVDRSLIRWTLSLTPQERMNVLQANADALVRLRNAEWIDGQFVMATNLAVANLANFSRARRSGAVALEIIRDIAFHLHPVSERQALEMIQRISAYPLLSGARGDDPVDEAELARNIARLSQLVGDLPEISEMEINPFFIAAPDRPSGAADARVRLR